MPTAVANLDSLAGLSSFPDMPVGMSPRNFLSSFGVPIPSILSVLFTTDTKIPPHLDRYLLIFWHSDSDLLIAPALDGAITTIGFTWTVASQPLVLSHGSHGGLVNIGWRLQKVAAGTANVTVIEGFMRPKPKTRRKG